MLDDGYYCPGDYTTKEKTNNVRVLNQVVAMLRT